MPETIPTTEPTELRAGENWNWDRRLSDYLPSSGWALSYALRGPTDLDITAQANGDVHEVRVSPLESDGVIAGTYTLAGFVEKGDPVTDRVVVFEDTILVAANPLLAVNAKSHAETVYEAITAVMEGRATTDQERFSINGREIHRIPVLELLRLKNLYADQIRLERNPGRLSPGVEIRAARA